MKPQRTLRFCPIKPRIFVISDIANEPDDAQSFIRLLLYGNEIDIKGLVACTSNWMRTAVHPEEMETIIHSYASVVSNLNAHVHPQNRYPTAEYLLSILKTGPPLYGKCALDPDVQLSHGAELLIEQLSASKAPLWVLCWGGTNVLAQALQYLDKTETATSFVSSRFVIPNWEQSAYDIEIIHLPDVEVEAYHVASQDSVLVPWPSRPLNSRGQARVRVRVYGMVEDSERTRELGATDWSQSWR